MIDDIKELAKIEKDCWKTNLAPVLNITEYLYFQTIESISREIETIYKYEDVNVFKYMKKINAEQEEIVGFAITSYNNQKNKHTIKKFFVNPKYQNQGIGQKILDTIINNFKNISIDIQTFEKYRPMQHILIKKGFKCTRTTKGNITYGKNIMPIKYTYYIKEGEK